MEDGVRVFSTCPASNLVDQASYLRTVVDVARWSEESGCHGILVYTDNGLVDPWLVSQVIVQNTRTLSPLVAVQPVYMHPYTVAKMISTIGYLYGRRLCLNMVAGGFKNDLESLNDPTPHDRRYDRVIEYTEVIKLLLGTSRGIGFTGEFYEVRQLKMTPPLPEDLFPGLYISGSSDAGVAAARAIGAVAVRYPKPVDEYEQPFGSDPASGVRVGIIAREDGALAWAAARERFPEDRRGQIAHGMAMKVSDSVWHRQLSELGRDVAGTESPYWLHPFENYKTFCPYLVGSYEVVAREVSRYMALGCRTFILDVPSSPEELVHIGNVFRRAASPAAP
jgi:alkanesulfonate monooxygenase